MHDREVLIGWGGDFPQKNKNPDDVEAHLGMVSGFYYLGYKKKALKYCESAKRKTTNKEYLAYIDGLILDIEARKDIFK